jgi:hypothetical protein
VNSFQEPVYFEKEAATAKLGKPLCAHDFFPRNDSVPVFFTFGFKSSYGGGLLHFSTFNESSFRLPLGPPKSVGLPL